MVILAWLDSASYSVPFFGAGARWVLFDSASYSVPCFGADARWVLTDLSATILAKCASMLDTTTKHV